MKKIKEEITPGIYDRPIAEKEKDSEGFTVGEEVPLSPVEHMRNQLSVERPPIEDEKFIPGSVEELSRAASAISSLVPSSEIEFYYRSLHDLLDQATDRAGLPEESKEVAESSVKKLIGQALLEILSDTDKDELDAYRGRDYDTGGVDYFGDNDPGELPSSSSSDVKSKSDGTVSLDQIAAEFGYSGASGVRQEIKRLTDRLQYFVTKVSREDLDALIDYAVGEYVDVLSVNDLLDPGDEEVLKSSPQNVKQSPSFKFFFVASFIIPAYREITRLATRSLNDSIEALGIPQNLHQTVFNQVTGASKQGTIAKKLASMVKSAKIDKEEALDLVRKIESAIPSLKQSAEKSSDIVQRSLDKWQSTSPRNRRAALEQALEQG